MSNKWISSDETESHLVEADENTLYSNNKEGRNPVHLLES